MQIKRGAAEVEQAEHRICKTVKTLCLVMKDTCHYTFVQTHKLSNTKSEP